MGPNLRFALLAALASLAACGPAAAVDPDGPRAPATEGFPLDLESANGRTATLSAPARRILAGNAGALDQLLVVADDTWIAAINAGTRPYSVALKDPERMADVPVLATFDIEAVANLAPDLVVTHAWQTLDKGPFLERLGIPVLELGEAETWEDLERDLTLLGAAVDRPQRARIAIDDLRARRAALAAVDRSEFEVLTLSGGDTGTWSAGAGTTAATLVGWVGATHLPSAAGYEGHFQLDHELLLELDPSVLVVTSEDGTLEGSSSWRALVGDPRLAGLRVRSGDGLAVALPSRSAGTTSHHLLDAAELLAAALDRQKAEK